MPSPADNTSMQAAGVQYTRLDFNWFQFQPTSSGFNFGYLDAVVADSRAKGLAIYATVGYTPRWASSLPTCTQNSSDEVQNCNNKRPANVQAWRDAMTAVVTRYAGQIDCWGIWNEPNLRTFFDGTMDQFVNEIFLPAAQAIRAADPNGRICGPELSGLGQSSSWNGRNGTCVLGSCIRNGWELDLGQMLDRVGQHIDVITQHTYKSDGEAVMTSLITGEYTVGVLTHDAVRRVIDGHGGANKEFWLTETGWEHPPQGGVNEADIATRIVQLYTKQEEVCAGTWTGSLGVAWPNWTRTYYYHYPYDPGSGWGIVGPNQAPLAPYNALKNWTLGRTTTACTGPGGVRPDGGVVTDAGVTLDAGIPPVDAGTTVDAGSAVDAGVPQDAGTPPVDAGVQPDAGEPPDAGTAPASDAGVPGAPDGGGGTLEPAQGCSCDSTPANWTAVLWALSLLVLPRLRRHR